MKGQPSTHSVHNAACVLGLLTTGRVQAQGDLLSSSGTAPHNTEA